MQLVTKGRFLSACAVAALCGCAVGPDYQLSEVAVPVSYGFRLEGRRYPG